MPPSQRDAILDATRSISSTEGFKGLTMRRVAREVGLTAPALYRHFPSKKDLIAALVVDARDTFMAYLVQALEAPTAWERFERAGERYLAFALDRPQAYELLFMTPNQYGLFGMPNSLELWREQPPPTFQFAIDRVAECMRSGDLEPGDPTQVALSLAAMAHGLVSLFLAGRFGANREAFTELYRSSLDRLYVGIRVSEFPPSSRP